MHTDDALLAAVWAAPHDDLPRLVYADWLDETGGPLHHARAELIRVQCAAERTDDPAERRQLHARQDELWHRWQSRVLPKATTPRVVRTARYSRGFPYPRVNVDGFLRRVQTGGLDLVPLWDLQAWERRGAITDLLARPEPLRIGRLDWPESDAGLPALVDGLQLRTVSHLELGGRPTFGPDIRRLGRSPHAAAVRHLSWSSMLVTEDEFADFLQSPVAAALRSLDFRPAFPPPNRVEALAATPARSALRRLWLSGGTDGERVIRVLVRGWTELRELRLREMGIGPEGCRELAAWPGLARLETLDLGGNRIEWEGVKLLAASPYLKCSPHCDIRVPPGTTRAEVAEVREQIGPAPWWPRPWDG